MAAATGLHAVWGQHAVQHLGGLHYPSCRVFIKAFCLCEHMDNLIEGIAFYQAATQEHQPV